MLRLAQRTSARALPLRAAHRTFSAPLNLPPAKDSPKDSPAAPKAPETPKPKAEAPRETAPEAPLRYGQVKSALLRRSRVSRLFSLAVLAAGASAVAYYFTDSDNTPERKLGTAVNMLRSNDVELRKDGFKLLNDSLFVTKRVFSGPIGVPVSNSDLSNENLIGALLDNVSHSDEALSTAALIWLNKLARGAHGDEVRAIALKLDPNLNAVLGALSPPSGPFTSKQWIIAASLIHAFKEDGAFLRSGKFVNAVHKLGQSGDPVAISLAARLLDIAPEDVVDRVDKSTLNRLLEARGGNFSEKMNYLICNTATQLVVEPQYSSIGLAPPPHASFLSILGFSVLGALWGRTMWFFSARSNSDFRTLALGINKEKAYKYRTKFLRTRHMALGLFMLMSLDYFGSVLLSIADQPQYKEFAKLVDPVPVTSAVPMIQTSLFTLGALYLIRTRRFVIVPLALALLYNHYDYFKKYDAMNALVEEAGDKVNALVEPYKKKAKELTQKATEML